MKRKYLNFYLKFINRFSKIQKPLKVVADCSNGALGPIFSKLKIKNVKMIIINQKPDGHFPAHGPDPLKRGALSQVSKMIKKKKADLGLVFDGDGDRVVFLDNQGKLIEPYIIAYLLFLNHKKPFVVDILLYEALKYSQLLLPKTYPSRVGHYFIKKLMKRKKATIGAEYSGHYHHQDFFFSEDGLLTAIKIMNILSELPYQISQLKKWLPCQLEIKTKNIKTQEPDKFIETIKKIYQKKAKKISLIDGLTLEFKYGWLNLRPSNTEPYLRINIGRIKNKF